MFMISKTMKIIQFKNNTEFVLNFALYLDILFNVNYDIVLVINYWIYFK